MSTAKDIRLRPIGAKAAREIIKGHHYSGKVVNNSNLHIGVFLHGRLEGAMQLGPPLDKRKLLGLVQGTGWGNMMELNRMAFSDNLPRNSESRSLAVLTRVIREHAPQIKWIVSFADGTVVHKMTCESSPTTPRPEAGGRSYYAITGGRYAWGKYVKECGGTIIPGYQLRYIKFIDPTWRNRLTVPILPYSEINRRGAGMYLGEKR